MKNFSSIVISDTYADVKLLLDDIVHRFQKKYGGEWEELRSQANVIFMEVHKNFDHTKGKFSAMLGYIISYRLLDNLRYDLRKKQIRIEKEQRKLRQELKDNSQHFYDNFIRDLSEDAITVVDLIFCPPREVILTARTIFGERNRRSMIFAVTQFLSDTGWTAKRIFRSFSELREAINDDV